MVECPHCNKLYPIRGLHTHIMRTHLKVGFEGSQGRHKSYNDKKYRDNISLYLKLNAEKRNGPIKEFTVNCCKCSKQFSVFEPEKRFPKKSKYFCSRSCSNSRTLTEETRNKISAKLTGNTNNKVTLELSCLECGSVFYNKKANKFCSRSCSSKYTSKSRSKHLDKTSLSYYRRQCAFKFNLKDYPEEFDFSLIEQFGWYKAKNRGDNLNGVSRDHIISIRFGYDNNIDPYIMSHPANCQLLQHRKNSSKGKKSNLSLDELIEKINIWNLKYNMALDTQVGSSPTEST